MANKKINQLVSKTSILSTDLFGIGDATTGQLYKKTIAELQAAIGGAVISVNGLVGTVVLDTDDIQELATPTNKYFTDARARGAISLTVTGNSGASTYSSGTGVLNVPTYTLAGLGGISATFLSGTSGISYNSTTGVISYSGTVYTDASIRALLSAGTGIIYNSSTGAISYSGTVYTDSSVRALISITTTGDSGASTYNNTTGVINVPNYTLAGLGGISLTSLSGGAGITYNSSTGEISYSGTVYTDASVRALISATGSVSYNNTTGVISLTGGNLTEATSSVLTITGGTGAVLGSGTTIQVKQASSTVSGFLSSTDWSTFNGKANALSGTTGYHAKFTSSTAIGNSAIFENGNNILLVANAVLGINTSDASDNGYLALAGASEDGTARGGHIYLSGNERSVDAGSVVIAGGTTSSGTGATASVLFRTSGSERMRITSAGTVGIGVTPASQNSGALTGSTEIGGILRIQGGNGRYFTTGNGLELSRLSIYSYNRDTSAYNDLSINDAMTVRGGGNILVGTSTNYALGNDNNRGIIINGVNPYTPFISFRVSDVSKGVIYANINEMLIYAQANIPMTFGTNDTERGRITAGGNWLLGTTSDNGERLYVSGSIRATGSITANSDISLKKNLLKIENALEKVEQINGYTYELKADDSKRHGGVIAQEIQTVFPEIVNTGNDGLMGVEYGNISALLIEAIKEQQTQIKELKALLNK